MCGADAAQFLPALEQASHGLSARGHFALRVGAQPGRPASSGSVTLHDLIGRVRLMAELPRDPKPVGPSKRATPSVPGSESGKVRRPR